MRYDRHMGWKELTYVGSFLGAVVGMLINDAQLGRGLAVIVAMAFLGGTAGYTYWWNVVRPGKLRTRRLMAGCCPDCGYNLKGNTSGTCPECGKPA